MIIATAGHVDHGKTSLVHAITGIDTDRLEEEKSRGLTIDLGFAYQHEDQQPTLGFVDVPGHIRFINNMLAGVSGIDHALLIVAADDGPMPQTQEHLDILDLLKVESGTIVITKVDRVSAERVSEVMELVRSLVAGTSLAGSTLFAASGTTGQGVKELKAHLLQEAGKITARTSAGNFRLSIDRRFNVKGSGLVVTGSVFAGQVKVGDELTLSPAKIPVRVRGIHAQNKKTDLGQTGDRCAINLTGSNLHRDLVHRGDWLVHPALAVPTSRFDGQIKILRRSGISIKHLTSVHVHCGASHVTGRIALLEGQQLNEGDQGLVQLITEEPLCLCHGDRFIIRDQAARFTLGGGLVLDPFAPGRGRARPARIEILKAMAIKDVADSLRSALSLAPQGSTLR